MSMLDDMIKLASLQQISGGGQGQMMPQDSQMFIQQPMPQENSNPIASGSNIALDAVKRSLQMSDSENQRALTRGMFGMMSSIYNNPHYGQGVGGNIAATVSGVLPFLDRYDAERNRISNINYAILSQQKEEERLARREAMEMRRLQQQMELAEKKLGIEQSYLSLEKQKREDERREHAELEKAGAKIPLSTLKPSQWNIAQKEIQSNLDRGQAAHDTLQSIYAAKHILKNDPHITKNMSTIMLAAQRHDPSIVRQKLNSWFIPEETRVNAEMLAKNLSNIYTSKLKGFPARGMNMFLEKQLREGNVDINMSSDSIIKLLDKDEKALNHIYKGAQEVYDEYEKGYFYRPRPIKIETEMIEEENQEPATDSKRQKILDEISRLEQLMETAPE